MTIPTSILVGASGIAVTFHGPITIPVWPSWQAVITGYTVQAGVAGPEGFDLNQFCCAPGVRVGNGYFSLLPPAYPPGFAPPDVLTTEADTIAMDEGLDLPADFALALTPAERLIPASLQCLSPSGSTQEAAHVQIVRVSLTCREMAYNQNLLQAQASRLLEAQAAHTLGPGHHRQGTVTVQVLAASLTLQGSVLLRVRAQGRWSSH